MHCRSFNAQLALNWEVSEKKSVMRMSCIRAWLLAVPADLRKDRASAPAPAKRASSGAKAHEEREPFRHG